MDLRFPFSPAEVAKVRVVQFGILSPDEIVILTSLNVLNVQFHCWECVLGVIELESVNDSCDFLVYFVEANLGRAYRAQRDDGKRQAEDWRFERPASGDD